MASARKRSKPSSSSRATASAVKAWGTSATILSRNVVLSVTSTLIASGPSRDWTASRALSTSSDLAIGDSCSARRAKQTRLAPGEKGGRGGEGGKTPGGAAGSGGGAGGDGGSAHRSEMALQTGVRSRASVQQAMCTPSLSHSCVMVTRRCASMLSCNWGTSRSTPQGASWSGERGAATREHVTGAISLPPGWKHPRMASASMSRLGPDGSDPGARPTSSVL
mmetsp:Transcript_3847/g.11918  ORF Transcript_3847/g.11918 Transcript_3847/m.11918 type:complete len:222 (+) Transcript_3847:244-909(+)